MKKYIAPSSKLVLLRTETHMLSSTTEHLGGMANSETVGFARGDRRGSWSDDEEEDY